jgi:predicted AAA+ superfamily ATPase
MFDAKPLYRINYYDIKGKRIILTSEKLYATDIGILNAYASFNNNFNLGFKSENIVLLELLNNNYEVYTFKTRNGIEIDFLAIKNEKKYIYKFVLNFHQNQCLKENLKIYVKLKMHIKK